MHLPDADFRHRIPTKHAPAKAGAGRKRASFPRTRFRDHMPSWSLPRQAVSREAGSAEAGIRRFSNEIE